MSKLRHPNDQTSHFSVSGTTESARIASGGIQFGVPTTPLRLAADNDIETASEHPKSQILSTSNRSVSTAFGDLIVCVSPTREETAGLESARG